MDKEIWIEVRLLVPVSMQEEAACFLTEFSGRGVILEEEDAAEAGALIRAFFQAEDFGAWQQEELQEYLRRLGGHGLFPLPFSVRRAVNRSHD